jgi:hypothetical protein
MQSKSATHLTVRNVPGDVRAALDREKRLRGTSMNQTVIDLLREGLGITGVVTNGLARLAGTWTRAEQQEFLSSIQPLNEINPDLWN